MLTKILGSLCTEIDEPALKYPTMYRGLNSIFEWITQPQFNLLYICIAWLVWLLLGPEDPLMLIWLASCTWTKWSWKVTDKEIILMFSYILVVFRCYILLISLCPMLKKLLLYLQFYLKITTGEQKYGDFFLLNCSKILLIVLCWKSW